VAPELLALSHDHLQAQLLRECLQVLDAVPCQLSGGGLFDLRLEFEELVAPGSVPASFLHGVLEGRDLARRIADFSEQLGDCTHVGFPPSGVGCWIFDIIKKLPCQWLWI